jgi:glycosyltransferase involved in cell wall biosynthesis
MIQSMTDKGICILPKLNGMGGPVSFYHRLTAGFEQHGIQVVDSPLSPGCKALLVIGGTRRLDVLWRARRRGVRIVQRLNGMNWMHRRRVLNLTYYLRAETNNWLLSIIRKYIANRVVYQSQFARAWWQTVYKPVEADGRVIFNGVDLDTFSPIGPGEPPDDHIRILLVEAHVAGGYEKGLENAIQLAQSLQSRIAQRVELVVVGDVPAPLRTFWSQQPDAWITWKGVQQHGQIPQIDRSAHILFSSDLNAACPNSVIEAMACGLPVVAYATGSLPELVEGDAGKVVPYGSNYWKLEPPEVSYLADAAREILSDLPRFRQAARSRAEALFGVEKMVDDYLQELLGA